MRMHACMVCMCVRVSVSVGVSTWKDYRWRERGHEDEPRDCTIESHDYAPLCMLALSKSGEGAYTWDPNISVLQSLPTVECHVGAQSLYCLLLFGGNNLTK